MGKVVQFKKSDNDKAVDFVKMVIEEMEKENIDNIILACKIRSNNTILTGYCNVDMNEKQELLGHLQIDVIKDMINQNYITP